MLKLKEIREWLKTQIHDIDGYVSFYIGKIDANKEKVIGIYGRNSTQPPTRAIGNTSSTTYSIKPISVLVHWTKNADITEDKAIEVFNIFNNSERVAIANTNIIMFKILCTEPIPTGTDERNIYEYVIDIDVYYERNN